MQESNSIASGAAQLEIFHNGNWGGKCLNVYDNGNVVVHTCMDIDRQQWYWSGEQLKTLHNSLCLEASPSVFNLYTATCNDGDNQQWYWSGALQLTTRHPFHNNMCMHYSLVSYSNWGSVQMQACDNSDNQKFSFPFSCIT